MIIRTKIEIPVSDENKAIAELIATKCNVTVEEVIAIAFNQFQVPIDFTDTSNALNARLKSELKSMELQTSGYRY